MRLPGLLGRAQADDWRSGVTWLIITSFFGLLPVWAGALVFFLFSSNVSWAGFLDNGEFAIYSAALVATALLIVFREYDVGFKERLFWGVLAVFLLVIALILFVAASAADTAPDLADQVNRGALRVFSILVYAGTLSVVFLLTVLNKGLEQQNLERIRGERMSRLEDRLDDVRGGK